MCAFFKLDPAVILHIVFQRCEMRIQMRSRYFKSMGVKHITHSGNCCNVCFLIISGHLKTNTETKYYLF